MENVLIWGASGGIGRALVRLFKNQGWHVVAAGRNHANIPIEAGGILLFDADKPDTFRDIYLALSYTGIEFDLVIYAVGSIRSEAVEKLPPEDWITVVNSNLTGAFLAANRSLGLLKPNGQMVFIGAYIDPITMPKMSAYAAAKAGLNRFVKVLRRENPEMRFTIVRPGAVDTNLWRDAPIEKPDDMMSPDTVAQAILNHYISGTSDDLNL